jgi:hypothetical protein
VLHFVTGGFSGATQVAVDLVRAHGASGRFDALLVLRRKRTTLPERVRALQADGLRVELVPGWSHAATVWALASLCRRFQPDILVAHGYSEHLWGRYAGLLAGCGTGACRAQLREALQRLALGAGALWPAVPMPSWGALKGCAVRCWGMDFRKTVCMPFQWHPPGALCNAPAHTFVQRIPGIVMAARFARQKTMPPCCRRWPSCAPVG